MKFVCQRCGFCCGLDVRLYDRDIAKIEKLGYKDFHTKNKLGTFLKKKNGKCVFYNKEGCSIYEQRPYICKKFPHESDGKISYKCTQRDKNFHEKVDFVVLKFILEEEKAKST